MDDNGQRQQDDFEQRLYQVLALLERAGEQQRAAANTLEQLAGLEQRVNQAIQAAGAEAATRIAEEARSALDGAIADSAASLRQAARGAVAAAEDMRQPWWIHLIIIVLTGILSAALAFWATHTSDIADYQQNQRSQTLIHEGQMLERVWPKLTPAERKRIEQLDNE